LVSKEATHVILIQPNILTDLLVLPVFLVAYGAVEVREGTGGVDTGGLGQIPDGQLERLDVVLQRTPVENTFIRVLYLNLLLYGIYL